MSQEAETADMASFRVRGDRVRDVLGFLKSEAEPRFRRLEDLTAADESARRERSKQEQLLKFRLLPLAIQVIHKSGTLQEYRKTLAPVGKKSPRDGSVQMKEVQYWGFVAIAGTGNPVRIRVIIRRVGDGNITFWSVMPDVKIKDGRQKLFSANIEDKE